jgi:hypothetical protein
MLARKSRQRAFILVVAVTGGAVKDEEVNGIDGMPKGERGKGGMVTGSSGAGRVRFAHDG